MGVKSESEGDIRGGEPTRTGRGQLGIKVEGIVREGLTLTEMGPAGWDGIIVILPPMHNVEGEMML